MIHKFDNIFRYLDVYLSPNNDDFSIYTKEIYPDELSFDKAFDNNKHFPDQDIDVYVFNDKLSTKS